MIPPTIEKAVSDILNQYFNIRGIYASATYKDNLLKIILESAQVPEPESTVSSVVNAIATLKITSLEKVKVIAKQRNTFDIAWGRELELGSQNGQSVITKSEVKTGNYNSKSVPTEEFQRALEESTKTAEIAYKKTLNYYKEIHAILVNLNSDLNKSTSSLLKQKYYNKFNFNEVLKNISDEIKKHADEELQEMRKFFEIKSQHLAHFTVVLFGRTKTGKSTIREALTCGDGSTIGTGSQRTTRDVREYRWKSLRLVDTPGIEAYQGDEDKQKAQEIVHRSDIVIFLTSDDSVQPGEFDAMAWLQEIKKYFFVILNVKYDIDNSKRLERFIKNPEKIFDSQRLDEHKRHIRTYIQQSLSVKEVEIISIHAYAAFLSNRPQHYNVCEKLWQLSQIEEVYSLIVSEIHTRGKKRRWDTFFDAITYFIDSTITMLKRHQSLLLPEVYLMQDKRREMENIFQESVRNGKIRIQSLCQDSFSRIKQSIPSFIDEYLGKDIAHAEYQKLTNKEKQKIEAAMESLFQEIVQELVASLNEFQRQYQYDIGTINFKSTDFGKYQQWQVGKTLKWAGVGLGAASAIAFSIGTFAAANFWNPVGWGATAVSVVVGICSWFFNEQEKKAWQKARQEAKETLWENLDKSEQETCKTYQKLLDTDIGFRAKTEVLEEVDICINELREIIAVLQKFILQLERIKKEIQRESIGCI